MFIPIMGTTTQSGLASALFTPVQQRVLGLLFGQPKRRFQSAELIRLAASGTGAAHRVLQRLTNSGLVTVTAIGNQKHYQANPDSPVYRELSALVRKTAGLAYPVAEALRPLTDQITAAFVYGSAARGHDRADSDIDLMVVSDGLRYPDLISALAAAEKTLGRTINPHLMNSTEWRRKRADTGFAARISEQPQLYVIGSKDELEATRKSRKNG